MYLFLISSYTTQNMPNSAGSILDTLEALFRMYLWIMVLIIIVTVGFPIAVRIALGLLSSTLAGEKGYSKFGFFWFGFFYFPFAITTVILAQDLNEYHYRYQKDDFSEYEEEAKEYEKMYEAGTLTYTQLCQKLDELKRRKYYE